MRPGQLLICTGIGVLVATLAAISAEVCAAPPSSVGPAVFGQVFRSTRHAMLRVRTRDERRPFATGFLIGAQGEFIFGARGSPEKTLAVITSDGIERTATLLGLEPSLGLAVGRIDGDPGAPPLNAAAGRALALEQWVVVLQHDAQGVAEPFAGVVERSAQRTLLGPRDQQARFAVARVAAPGVPGSPVLSLRGELVAVVFEEGARKTRVVMLDSVLPFLRSTILGP